MDSKISILVKKTSGVLSQVTLLLGDFGFTPLQPKISDTSHPQQSRLDLVASGNGSLPDLMQGLLKLDSVVSILDGLPDSGNSSSVQHHSEKTAKAQCKSIMEGYFGSAIAVTVDAMSDEECVAKCRAKVAGLIGEQYAKVFDQLK